MKYIVSRYNQSVDWLADYTDDFIVYDRSEEPMPGEWVKKVPNVGSDIHDKLTFIIDHYENLPDVAVYAKANLFKYITKEEFDRVKDNQTFTPLLTKNHRTYNDADGNPVCFYHQGIYWERNNFWYLGSHRCKDSSDEHNSAPMELIKMLGMDKLLYVPFAPGSNYILPKENILKHPKEFYEKLRSYLMWDRYPGEAMIIERGLYTIWR